MKLISIFGIIVLISMFVLGCGEDEINGMEKTREFQTEVSQDISSPILGQWLLKTMITVIDGEKRQIDIDEVDRIAHQIFTFEENGRFRIQTKYVVEWDEIKTFTVTVKGTYGIRDDAILLLKAIDEVQIEPHEVIKKDTDFSPSTQKRIYEQTYGGLSQEIKYTIRENGQVLHLENDREWQFLFERR